MIIKKGEIMLLNKRSMMAMFTFVFIIVGCGGGGSSGGSGETPPPNGGDNAPITQINLTESVTVSATSYTDIPLVNAKIGSKGGIIEVSSGELAGIKIVVPEGAVTEDITFKISYANLASIDGLSQAAKAADRVIRIETSGSDRWNQYRLFDKLVDVTLPYPVMDDSVAPETIRFYSYDEETASFEAEGFTSVNTTDRKITFQTRTFANVAPDNDISQVSRNQRSIRTPQYTYADYYAIGVKRDKMKVILRRNVTLDTRFRPSRNGFYIPNYGSYYKKATGGACAGMTTFSKYYYKKGGSTNLYDEYHDPDDTTTWVDDATAIQLASRIQSGIDWDEYNNQRYHQTYKMDDTIFSSFGAMVITGKPVLLSLKTKHANGRFEKGGHSIMAYSVDMNDNNLTYHVYDPNWRGNDNRKLVISLTRNSEGYVTRAVNKDYYSGATAANSSHKYNRFFHVGYRAIFPDAVMKRLEKLADNNFAGGDKFPTFTLTKITAKTTGEVIFDKDDPSQTSDKEQGVSIYSGQKKYITDDTAVIIEGTVIGGTAQVEGSVVDELNIRTASILNMKAPINNGIGTGDGKFKFTLPLKSGESMIAMLSASKSNNAGWLDNWAAFKLLIIESIHQPAYLTATLTWDKGKSDIDLWVTEPGGDSVGYNHRASVSTVSPYLDFDNRSGNGPEHYIAIEGMSIPGSSNGLYGTYNIHANYYADHDEDDDHDQSISWNINWKYLEYCSEPCKDPEMEGFWNEGSSSGTLSSAGENSESIVFNYEKSDPEDWEILPEIHEVPLP